jgi:hypothetical protein
MSTETITAVTVLLAGKNQRQTGVSRKPDESCQKRIGIRITFPSLRGAD